MVAVLPEMVELLTVIVPLFKMPPPSPPLVALLPEMVELLTVRLPLLRMPPPPLKEAVLPKMVELDTVRVPRKELLIPPPLLVLVAELPEIVELEILSVPSLLKAPPPPDVMAPETVTPEMARFPPAEIVKILKLRVEMPLLPLIVRLEEPGPVMVRVPAVAVESIGGKAELSVMVPVTPEKTMISDAKVRLASTIARLREPNPKSLLFVTV